MFELLEWISCFINVLIFWVKRWVHWSPVDESRINFWQECEECDPFATRLFPGVPHWQRKYRDSRVYWHRITNRIESRHSSPAYWALRWQRWHWSATAVFSGQKALQLSLLLDRMLSNNQEFLTLFPVFPRLSSSEGNQLLIPKRIIWNIVNKCFQK